MQLKHVDSPWFVELHITLWHVDIHCLVTCHFPLLFTFLSIFILLCRS
uniref:Uncharacterized protein n=1 Tax=Arundo donax TaxID=35708 RepID=A0A0A9GQD8_ARUDO